MDSKSSDNDELAHLKWSQRKEDWISTGCWNVSGTWFQIQGKA